MMRQGITPAAFIPSSFYINHLETAHPFSVTWGIHRICDKMCSFSFSCFFNETYFNRLMLGVHFMLLHKCSSVCAVWISADMICNATTLSNNQVQCRAFCLLFTCTLFFFRSPQAKVSPSSYSLRALKGFACFARVVSSPPRGPTATTSETGVETLLFASM